MKVPYSNKIREVARFKPDGSDTLTLAIVRGQGSNKHFIASKFKGDQSAVLEKVSLLGFNKAASGRKRNPEKKRKLIFGLF